MTNKSFNPLFVSALDILTGALGVFIILNFLNTRLSGTNPPAPEPVAKAEQKPEKPEPKKPTRDYRPESPRYSTPAPRPEPKPEPTPTKTTPEPVKPTPEPVVNPTPQPPSPPQDPVAVDLMKSTKGSVAILLQQDGVAKQSVEFMLRQGKQTWKPSRASKYQDNEFKYEKSLGYFYQDNIAPGTYEVLVRVKRAARNGGAQPFGMFGKIIPPGQKAHTQNFGTYATSSTDWIPAGTFTVTATGISFKSVLPPASAELPAKEPVNPQPESPKTKPKKSGKWG